MSASVKKNKRRSARKLAGAFLVVVVFGSLGFFVAKYDVRLARDANLEEALSTVRQTLEEAEERLLSSEIFERGGEKDALIARVRELEAQIEILAKGSAAQGVAAKEDEELDPLSPKQGE